MTTPECVRNGKNSFIRRRVHSFQKERSKKKDRSSARCKSQTSSYFYQSCLFLYLILCPCKFFMVWEVQFSNGNLSVSNAGNRLERKWSCVAPGCIGMVWCGAMPLSLNITANLCVWDNCVGSEIVVLCRTGQCSLTNNHRIRLLGAWACSQCIPQVVCASTLACRGDTVQCDFIRAQAYSRHNAILQGLHIQIL